MGKEINLLPKRNLGVLQQERTILVLRVLAIFSATGVVSVVLGLFLLGKNYSVDAITAQQESVHAKIQLLQPKIQKELALVDRVNHIQAILKKRSSLVSKMSLLQSLIPQDVILETLSMTTSELTISLSSSSLGSLTKCIDIFTADLKKKTFFSTLTVSNVTVDGKTGIYKVNILAKLL